MKSLDQVKHDVAVEKGYSDWESLYSTFDACWARYAIQIMDIVAKRYAEEAINECDNKLFRSPNVNGVNAICEIIDHMKSQLK